MSIYNVWTVKDKRPKKCDCFIVLSYAVENKHCPTIPTKKAIELAYVWWKRFPKSYVIMSTGDNQRMGIPNSRIMKRYGIKIGIKKARILEEDRSYDTRTNIVYSLRLAKKHSLKNITFVMYDLHVKRMVYTAHNMGISDFCWVSTGGKGSPAYGLKFFQTYSRFTIFIYEILASIYYKHKGLI